MKVSKLWLDKFFDAPLPDAATLADALTFHAFEIDGVEKKGEDEVLDVKVTPNRGHDCLSHRGIAKELSAILKIPLAHDPFATKSDLLPKTSEVSVHIQRTDLCKRYIAGYVKGIKVGASPQWLKDRLEAIGQRSINNVVDATNFVMFNTGQPLHAFDAHKLGSLELGVRLAKDGEVMEALDKKQYTLAGSMLVITAGDKAVGIAGVKGGMPAAIDESTTDIVIESANFDGVSVRKTAAALKLRTDASARFEQGISPELAAYGMSSVAELVQKLAGGEVVGFVDVYPEPAKPQFANVTVEKVNQVLGTSLTGADVADVFVRLGLPYKEQSGVFEVSVPFERLDVVIPEDLAEEVGRIVGYDTIPATPLPLDEARGKPPVNPNFYAAERARDELVAQGYSEVFTSVFAEKGERAVSNKIGGDRPYLRSSLAPGLEDALKKNIPNKDLLGLKEIKLFEIGTVWKGGKEVIMLGTISEIGPRPTSRGLEASEKILEPLDVTSYDDLPLSTTKRFAHFSKYPYIVRDIAMWAAGGADAEAVIRAEAGPLAVKVSLFDRFEKAGKVSLGYRIVFQSFDRTLTEVEVNQIMAKLSAILVDKGFEIR
ncbi:MAG: phenylalanine--tRNA ligase subunit beta [Patescibacteria group bacterium]